MNNLQVFKEKIKHSVAHGTLQKLSLGNYHGIEPNLKQLIFTCVIIKKVQKISIIFRFQTKDITQNFEISEIENLLNQYLTFRQFRAAFLQTETELLQFDMLAIDRFKLKKSESTVKKTTDNSHNRSKNHSHVDLTQSFWHDLQITDKEGVVFKNAQDKFKQINHFLELLSVPLSNLSRQSPNIIDMGSGKGYLTFAIHHFLQRQGKKPHTLGVEFRNDMVQLCNNIAQKANLNDLSFVQSTIQEFNTEQIDLLIALHACDTATDDALAKGIEANAPLIVVAPCCHKQIRNEIEKGKAKNEISAITKYGTFLERQAEMTTDAIRCLILNYFGYKTKVLEFVSVEHTPKNVLIIAEKTKIDIEKQKKILEEIDNIKSFFGINKHYLELILKSI